MLKLDIQQFGGRGASSSSSLNNEINNIRNSNKENLIVTDIKGNILYTEKGTKNHTGYENYDYKDKITYHNHPEGVAPYPSEKDFETLEKTGMAKMIVVSKNYTYTYELDKNYKGYGKQGLSKLINANKTNINIQMRKINEQTIAKYKSGGYKNQQEYKQETIKLQREYINMKYQELAKNSGYKLTIKKKGKR